MNNLIERLEALISQISELKSHLNLSEKERRLSELDKKMQEPDFWSDNESAQKTSQEYTQTKNFYDFWTGLENDTQELLDIAKANTDESEETISYIESQVGALEEKYQKNRFVALLSKKFDDHNAIFALHAGAGGVDAQDWTEILLRMYLRFAERRGFKTEVLEMSRGNDAGIKSVLVSVAGPYAYGLLKSEAGVHRLVRQSPFNPAHTRETSFALLELLPELEEQEQVKLDPKDLKIEATTSSGHGGQSVNTTYSAIRITHIPTGLKVSIQNERSQAQNKELAMKILAARVQEVEDQKLSDEKKELRGEFKSAEWGNQIRSYVLHPYKLVKDHRTDYEETDPDKVLDGEIDEFIEKYLEQNAK